MKAFITCLLGGGICFPMPVASKLSANLEKSDNEDRRHGPTIGPRIKIYNTVIVQFIELFSFHVLRPGCECTIYQSPGCRICQCATPNYQPKKHQKAVPLNRRVSRRMVAIAESSSSTKSKGKRKSNITNALIYNYFTRCCQAWIVLLQCFTPN